MIHFYLLPIIIFCSVHLMFNSFYGLLTASKSWVVMIACFWAKVVACFYVTLKRINYIPFWYQNFVISNECVFFKLGRIPGLNLWELITRRISGPKKVNPVYLILTAVRSQCNKNSASQLQTYTFFLNFLGGNRFFIFSVFQSISNNLVVGAVGANISSCNFFIN